LDVKAVGLLQSVLTQHLAARGMVMLTTHQDVEITSGAHRHLNLDSWKN
jgi:heme exporter protein A